MKNQSQKTKKSKKFYIQDCSISYLRDNFIPQEQIPEILNQITIYPSTLEYSLNLKEIDKTFTIPFVLDNLEKIKQKYTIQSVYNKYNFSITYKTLSLIKRFEFIKYDKEFVKEVFIKKILSPTSLFIWILLRHISLSRQVGHSGLVFKQYIEILKIIFHNLIPPKQFEKSINELIKKKFIAYRKNNPSLGLAIYSEHTITKEYQLKYPVKTLNNRYFKVISIQPFLVIPEIHSFMLKNILPETLIQNIQNKQIKNKKQNNQEENNNQFLPKENEKVYFILDNDSDKENQIQEENSKKPFTIKKLIYLFLINDLLDSRIKYIRKVSKEIHKNVLSKYILYSNQTGELHMRSCIPKSDNRGNEYSFNFNNISLSYLKTYLNLKTKSSISKILHSLQQSKLIKIQHNYIKIKMTKFDLENNPFIQKDKIIYFDEENQYATLQITNTIHSNYISYTFVKTKKIFDKHKYLIPLSENNPIPIIKKLKEKNNSVKHIIEKKYNTPIHASIIKNTKNNISVKINKKIYQRIIEYYENKL